MAEAGVIGSRRTTSQQTMTTTPGWRPPEWAKRAVSGIFTVYARIIMLTARTGPTTLSSPAATLVPLAAATPSSPAGSSREWELEERVRMSESMVGAYMPTGSHSRPGSGLVSSTYLDASRIDTRGGVDDRISTDSSLDTLKAQAIQREFEEEDARLMAERAALQKEAQRVFECGVCFEEYPEDYVTRIAGCTHAFCRDCLKTYLVSKLNDKLYPIFCPTCVADNSHAEPGVISDDLAQMLGLNDQEYQILQELQIASTSILLHCRKCKESVFVDRAEYEAASTLVCPLPRCNYAWCKACQQPVTEDGPKHSCDGSSELEHLMKQHGWKHCPGCRTPFQKSSGCNHMTCMSPGCNTHFCYVCGQSIIRSALRQEIETAVNAHYNRCNL
ncbi:hypothetical protein DFH07DRAFT_315765 [Mycena maculata]|uniref:RBR-type E3 ubiquitin transferase n=1 Tax=Mycena maculata TaxID=230809 RepID=A0AAD7HFF5_9AGAR|nr:hypothetical protein DFH07DRAFT_315765 [Mycena maculata]